MIIVGVDYHPSVQQVAFLDTETGETGERRLNHSDGEAERFYRDLQRRQVKVRVGIEATGHARWFERLLAELKFELWIGDPARIKAARVRKQKTNCRATSIGSCYQHVGPSKWRTQIGTVSKYTMLHVCTYCCIIFGTDLPR
jgi:hypothetical protein